MKENTRFLLEKADSAIGAAETLLRAGYRDFAAGRAYYAMFYAAEALLAEKELVFKKHVGVHKAFSEHFIKPGFFEQKYYHWLIATFNSRLVGDYAIRTEFEDQEVQEWIISRVSSWIKCGNIWRRCSIYTGPNGLGFAAVRK